jgi:Lrp/AsnC family leucine-responsive transcriptional regulator
MLLGGELMRDTLVAFVFVQTRLRDPKTATLLARIPEVEELHRIAGEDCYVVRVRVANTEQLGRLVRDKIERIRSVHSTRTTIVLKTLKEKPVARPQRPSTSSAIRSGI